MKSNKNRKISKIIVIIISVITLLIIGALTFILSFLPGPKEIKSQLINPQEVTSTNKESIDQQSKKNDDESISQPSTNTDNQLQHEQIEASNIESKKKQAKIDLITRIIEEENVLSICENMREVSTYKVGQGKEQVDFDTIFERINDNDPVLGTIRYTLAHVFKDESLTSLLEEVFNSKIIEAGESEKSSILEKMNFYAKAAKTAIILRSRRKEFEALADRTEHLRLLAMIAQLKPNQAYDSGFLETCNSLQTSILNNEAVDIKAEREDILKIIKESGLTPKSLSFNPKNFTNYEVKLSKDGLMFKLDSEDDKKSN